MELIVPRPLSIDDKVRGAVGGRRKRAVDFVLGCLLLAGALPLMLIIAAAIKLIDGGAVFYSHERIGFNGSRFSCLKFRTMVPGSTAVLQELLRDSSEAREEWLRNYKLVRDPRVTRLGRFLRRWSLDELPQLLNVVAGSMSLVGPRPIVIAELALYGDKAIDYCAARPGITGLWQVSGRNRLDYGTRIGFDVAYVTDWSLLLDLRILALTAVAVLSGDGAC